MLYDTSAAAVVLEQVARLEMKSGSASDAGAAANVLEPMLDGMLSFLTPQGITDGCFNHPKRYADRSELIWGTAYLLFALYYLSRGHVPC